MLPPCRPADPARPDPKCDLTAPTCDRAQVTLPARVARRAATTCARSPAPRPGVARRTSRGTAAPSRSRDGEVALLVERLGVGPEVELPAVALQPPSVRRIRYCGTTGPRSRVGEAQRQQLLEPRVGHLPLVGDRRQLRQQEPEPRWPGRWSRSAVSWTHRRLGPAPAQHRSAPGARRAGRRTHRPEIDERPGQTACRRCRRPRRGRPWSSAVDVMGDGAVTVPPAVRPRVTLTSTTVELSVNPSSPWSRAAARCEADGVAAGGQRGRLQRLEPGGGVEPVRRRVALAGPAAASDGGQLAPRRQVGSLASRNTPC